MRIQKKYFSRYREPYASLPDLAAMQLSSYEWFIKEGLKEILDEFSPMLDYTEKELALEFVSSFVDEPRFDENHARINNLSYEAPLRLRMRLTNKTSGEKKEQEVFLADLPLMTPRGTFIINGVERVIVSQLARSFGVYFNSNFSRGKKLFGAKIIPQRGAWLEFDTEYDGAVYVRIDRKRKIAATALLRIFGFDKNEDIEAAFEKVDTGEILLQKEYNLKHLKDVVSVYDVIYKDVADLFIRALNNLETGERQIAEHKQEPSYFSLPTRAQYKNFREKGLRFA